jgi:hypothetical protein
MRREFKDQFVVDCVQRSEINPRPALGEEPDEGQIVAGAQPPLVGNHRPMWSALNVGELQRNRTATAGQCVQFAAQRVGHDADGGNVGGRVGGVGEWAPGGALGPG